MMEMAGPSVMPVYLYRTTRRNGIEHTNRRIHRRWEPQISQTRAVSD